MKTKTSFSYRLMSLLLVALMAFTMLPTAALAADTSEEHVHTEDCVHEEITVETEPVSVDTSAVEAEPTAEITVETEEVTITETEPVTEETAESADPYSGMIGESAVAWKIDPSTGRLTISGSGDCDDFTSADDQPWATVRGEITEVWFYDMDALAISDLAYWFDGCTALIMAEIPYTTPVIGTRAFANCPALRTVLIYHDGGLSIKESAFSADKLSALEIRYIPSSEATTEVLTGYEWKADNRAVFFEDVYGLSLLASGACHFCDGTYSYTLDYEYWTEDVHSIRHWCSNCGLDQCGGVNAESHTFSNGVCTKCGYDNGTGSGGGGGGDVGGGDTTCYHYSTYYSWSGCTYYEYCSNCGEYLGSGTSHGSTYTSWSGCDWYEYCRDCDELMDYGTSHGTYSYGAWEYYNSSRHRRYYSCNDCGEGSYSYGYHSTTTKYSEYSSTQHKYGSYCSTCSSYVGSTSYASHNFSYGSWSNYNATQHRRTVSCSTCGYSSYEYANHSLTYGNWTSYNGTQHRRTVKCSTCSYSSYEYANHTLTTGTWTSVSNTQHSRTTSCSCGYSTTETANHSLTYGDWEISEGTYYSSKHQRTVSCSCGYSTTEYEDHSLYGISDYQYFSNEYHMRHEKCDCGYPCDVYSYHTYTTAKSPDTENSHKVIKTCTACGHSTEESEKHTFAYGAWEAYDETQHWRTAECECGYSTHEYGDHYDNTGDDYCDDCGYLVSRFSVTLPAAMVMTVSEDGEIHTADNVAIINNSTHAVEITSVTVTAAGDWTLVPYNYNMAAAKVDTKLIGFRLNGAATRQTGDTERLSLPTNWTIDRADIFPLEYDAIVSATSTTMKNEQVLTLVFVIDWAPR